MPMMSYSLFVSLVIFPGGQSQNWVLSVGGPNMPETNPRWQTAAILKKEKTLEYICKGLTNFDKIWQGEAFRPLGQVNH